MDAVACDFIGSGFSADLTHYAMHALGTRIWGFSPEGFEPEPKDPPSATEEAARAEVLQQMAERYPNIAAITFERVWVALKRPLIADPQHRPATFGSGARHLGSVR